MNATCPTCGADVAQRDRHAAWHTELDRRLASLEDQQRAVADAQRTLLDAHREATCHEQGSELELARA